MLRALLMNAFGRAYSLPYKMATFIAKKGFFNTVYISLYLKKINIRRVVAEQIRASNTNSGVSVQQSVGLSPGRDTCVLYSARHLAIIAASLGWDVKLLVPCDL